MASLSQSEGDKAPIVLMAPAGFKVIQTEFGPDFHCYVCNVPAEP